MILDEERRCFSLHWPKVRSWGVGSLNFIKFEKLEVTYSNIMLSGIPGIPGILFQDFKDLSCSTQHFQGDVALRPSQKGSRGATSSACWMWRRAAETWGVNGI